ncbi:sensor histidine kinase [Lacipirellula limnantheis]|uniref:histidine kinase n=1 Tax=Lacipirellula limnantheis TaxID=2528024 RepID=A0A517U3X9_9BACT|nr:HAMP domain-containing sensor histidine kinase [Lacipirellula limnantheis]QDT75330.1 Sensor protein ZraS [Lacipirellula limnantheis]
MLSHWPIRTKLQLGLGLLLVAVVALFGSACYGLYAYRSLVKNIAARSVELPQARRIADHVNDLDITLSRAEERLHPSLDKGLVNSLYDEPGEGETQEVSWPGSEFNIRFGAFLSSLNRYKELLTIASTDEAAELSDDHHEWETLEEIDVIVAKLAAMDLSEASHNSLIKSDQLKLLREEIEGLRRLTTLLPTHLETQFEKIADDVKARYRTAIVSAWIGLGAVVVVLVVSRRVFYQWFADPLQVLVDGSRLVAAGHFDHRIKINAQDEIGELAEAMNAMTQRFCEIRDDLDRQVTERTNQVVRGEQLASVGFLAAGVSHEINNPLASIALCSESLESRLQDLLEGADPARVDEVQVARSYLQMIQREAFRCKQITEKLLDFARRGDTQRHSAELRELVSGVIEMVQHLGQYQDRNIELLPGPPAVAAVNAQEIKQVVLNLITNGLESLDPGGVVKVAIERDAVSARIVVSDNGCGMTEEVRKHLFEPFFTRRRSGQGTGLGLSITHRIIEEHRGQIEATSDGPGRGSRFVVSLPLALTNKETHHRSQAA